MKWFSWVVHFFTDNKNIPENKISQLSPLSPLGFELVTWTTDCLSSLSFFQRKQKEIQAMKRQLTKIEDLGDNMEDALILDIKYSTIGLAQQWDQLYQLGLRMQHNLEQQIQAKYWGNAPEQGGVQVVLGARTLTKG